MKKAIISFLLILSLLIVPFATLADDYSSKTDEELLDILNHVRGELTAREYNKEMIISQADNITVYLNKLEIEESYDDTLKLEISVTAINSGDKSEAVNFDGVVINGWEVPALDYISLEAGIKTKTTITVFEVNDKAEIKSVEEIQDLQFYSHSYDPETCNNRIERIRKTILMK